MPAEIGHWQRLEIAARKIFALYGFQEIRTPLLEQTPLFSRGIGENTQVVQKEMYTFEDKGGDSVTLRPEGTASVVRAYIEHSFKAHETISKLYYMGPMFRYERPQKGRLRQFHQIGAELIGIDSPFADAEVIIMLDRLICELGIEGYELQINSLGTSDERAIYIQKLVDYFSNVQNQLCDECRVRLEKNPLRILDCKVETCRALGKSAPVLLEVLGESSKNEFEILQHQLSEAKVNFVVNPRIVRGLDYYEKTAFEFTSSKLGSQSAFAGGGRYNRLIHELGGPETPAVGFAMGCERVVMLLNEISKSDVVEKQNAIYFVPLNESAFSHCRSLIQNMRDQGVQAEMDYELKSLKSQMRRADKLNFLFAAIVGEDEMKSGTVSLKNLQLGHQESVSQNELVGKIRA